MYVLVLGVLASEYNSIILNIEYKVASFTLAFSVRSSLDWSQNHKKFNVMGY